MGMDTAFGSSSNSRLNSDGFEASVIRKTSLLHNYLFFGKQFIMPKCSIRFGLRMVREIHYISNIEKQLMNLPDAEKVSQAVPGAIVIASHLDSVNHALLTRKDIIGLADESGLSGVRFRKMGNVQFHERDLGNTVRLLNYTLIYSGLVNGICAGRFRQRGLYRPRKGRGLRFPQLCPEALRGRGSGLRLLPPVRGK